MRPLPLGFYARPAAVVARALLGKRLVSTVGGARCALRIVEVEAYIGPDDPACHAFGWHRSARNETLYGRPGLLYVYFTYGMYWCANVVTEREGFPAAVLLRAIQPQERQETISARRQGRDCIGPAKLTQALAIDGALNGVDLCDPHSGLWIEAGPPLPESAILTGPRIGLYTVPEPWKSIPWRFRVRA